MLGVVGNDRLGDGGIEGILRHLLQSPVNDLSHIGLHKGLGNGGSHEPGAGQTLAVMGNTGGNLGVFGGLGGLAGPDQAPGVDEDLAADLVGKELSVGGSGARLRSGDAMEEVEVGGVLGGHAIAAPPEHTDALPGIVQPGLGHILRRQLAVFGAVPQGAEEIHRAVSIVIGGEVDVILHVAPDVAIGLLDPLIGPDVGLHRGAQTDAHVHTQETGIYFFEIIFLHGNAPVLLEIA